MPPEIVSPVKTAFVFVHMPVGGAEDFALAVARQMGPEFQPCFVCLRAAGQLGEEARASGLSLKVAPFFRSKRVYPWNIRRFAAWLHQENIKLVHSQNYHAHLFATRAAQIAGIPSVVHQQKTLAGLPWRRRHLFRRCLRRASRVVALSAQTAADLAATYGVREDRISILPNAIDESLFHPVADRRALRLRLGLPEEGLLLGSAARLHRDKNHACIIDALALLVGGGTEAHAVFLGEGQLRAELEARAVQRGVGPRIKWAGRQRPVAPWLQALDVFVLASTWEGQPLALLQAVACGTPVLASRVEGNVAVLGEDHPGLFDPHDPAALAALAARIASGDGLADALRDYQAKLAVPTAAHAAAQVREIYRPLVR